MTPSVQLRTALEPVVSKMLSPLLIVPVSIGLGILIFGFLATLTSGSALAVSTVFAVVIFILAALRSVSRTQPDPRTYPNG